MKILFRSKLGCLFAYVVCRNIESFLSPCTLHLAISVGNDLNCIQLEIFCISVIFLNTHLSSVCCTLNFTEMDIPY